VKPLARYAALNGYLDLGRSLGLDPVGVMRSEGLDPAGLGLPDRWVPAASIARLLEKSAAASGRQDVGLQLAERRRFANIGPLSLILRDEPDVRSAVRLLMRSEHTYNESLRLRLSEQDGVATIRVGLELGEITDARQSLELAVGALHRLLRGFLGARWQPLAVCFAHPAPADTSTHVRMFGSGLRFDHEFSGVVCDSSDLDSPNRMADPQLRPYAQQILESLQAREEATTLNRVREIIELLLPTGRCSVEQVARSLGIDRRTVHRHLARSGETFSSVLDRTRAELAVRMVEYRRHSLTEVAGRLGFSTPSNFSRWFRARFGCSPSRWGER
jgi:AraC-like DNA-binding protein